MNADAQIVFAILALTILAFVSEKIALDIVGILALFALYFTGILTPTEILSGFSSPVVVTLAALFIVGGALFRTGVAATLGEWLARRGSDSPGQLIVSIMGLGAVLSAFMSSTGTAAILIPAVVGVAKKSGISPSKLLMPLAYGCLIGGMLTLVGTPPNLVVQAALIEGGHKPFGFLSFAPMGLLVLVLGMLYMVHFGAKLLPDTESQGADRAQLTAEELAAEYRIEEKFFRWRVTEDSKLLGKRFRETGIRDHFHLNVVGVQSGSEDSKLRDPSGDQRLEVGQILHLYGDQKDLERFIEETGGQGLAPVRDYAQLKSDGGVAELLLTPRSRLIGQTLKTCHFKDRFRVNVVSLMRRGKILDSSSDVHLKFGDALLVAGSSRALACLHAEIDNFVVTGMPEDSLGGNFRREKAWLAVSLAILMLILMTFKLLPSVMAVMLIATAAILLGCLNSEEAYRSISWQSLILIAAMLPLALALEKTGGVDFVAQGLTSQLGVFGPSAIMAGLFVLTSVFSQFISNTATTVIMTPIALQAALQLQVAPHAFLMAVAVAASAAFVTPVASPVNMLVLTPARYRFVDFVRVGWPLQVLVLIMAVLLLPVLFPLRS